MSKFKENPYFCYKVLEVHFLINLFSIHSFPPPPPPKHNRNKVVTYAQTIYNVQKSLLFYSTENMSYINVATFTFLYQIYLLGTQQLIT